MQEFKKFAEEVQEHLRRTWNDFCKNSNEQIAETESFIEIRDISNQNKKQIAEAIIYHEELDAINIRLRKGIKEISTVMKKVKDSKTITAKSKKIIEESINNLEPVLKEARTAFKSVQKYLLELEQIEKREQVIEDRADTLVQQIGSMLETVALGLTAEALSHEIDNIVDAMAERSDAIKKHLSAVKNNDHTLAVYIEYMKSTAIALRKQLSYLSPAVRYVRDKKHVIVLSEFCKGELETYFQAKLLKNGISIKTELGKDKDFAIKINKGKLLQMFDNFILNSEYWLKEDIRMNRLEAGKALITIEIANPFILISDNGRGVDPRYEGTLFEPFVTAKIKGRGLGLYIVQQLLDS